MKLGIHHFEELCRRALIALADGGKELRDIRGRLDVRHGGASLAAKYNISGFAVCTAPFSVRSLRKTKAWLDIAFHRKTPIRRTALLAGFDLPRRGINLFHQPGGGSG